MSSVPEIGKLVAQCPCCEALDNPHERMDKIYVYRVVAAGLLISLIWKSRWIPLFFDTYQRLPIADEFFPGLMRDPEFLAALYLVPIALILAVLFVASRGLMLAQSLICTASMFGLCIHQQSYNDVTFVTCFWVSAWSVWYMLRMGEDAEVLYSKGAKLAVLIYSMIFLGGAVGKLTPGYWSGEVFHEIYFSSRDYWIFNLLRGNLEEAALRDIATYYSRFVILIEGLGAMLWLLPNRIACAAGILILLSIALLSNTNLFSVMSCLIALGLVGLHEPKKVNPANY